MKIYRIILTVVAFCLLCTSVITLSLGWFSDVWPISPALPFSAGGTRTYIFRKFSFNKDGTLRSKAVDSYIGGAGATLSDEDLQFGTLNNLSFLESDNVIFFAVEIPYEMGTEVHAALSFGKYAAEGSTEAAVPFGEHFTIHVRQRDENGDFIFDDNGEHVLGLYSNDNLAEIRQIEAMHGKTFINYSCVLSAIDPESLVSYEDSKSFENMNGLFEGVEIKPLATMTKEAGASVYTVTMNDPAAQDCTYTLGLTEGESAPAKYYLYVKLQPNMELYKYFIDYLVNEMPFYLSYQVGIQLSVNPTAKTK